MNIFATSADAVACARALDDLRLNKMIVESCQILCTVRHGQGRGREGMYRAAYARHPVVVWAGDDRRNYVWLYRHLEALFQERAWRTGKGEHASLRLLPLLRPRMTAEAPTRFVNCTPYPEMADVHAAYRRMLREKWGKDVRAPRWTRRGAPKFARGR